MKRIYLFSLLLGMFSFHSLNAQCIIQDVIVEASPCNNINEFTVDIEFEWAGGGDSVVIVGNGNNYGTYAKADLPYTLSSPFFIGDGVTIYEFIIYDTELVADCSAAAVLAPVLCGPPMDCGITGITYALTPCDTDGNFTITLDFDWEFTSDFFTVFGNGNNYGNFSYTDVPVTLGPFPGDGTEYEFVVADLVYLDCGGVAEPGAIICPPFGSCEIYDLVVETGNCTPNGVFDLWINFEVEYPGNDFFDLWIDSEFIGFYPLDELPLELNYGSSNSGGLVQVCVNDNPDCCAFMQYENPCNNSNDCEIWDLTLEPTPCNDLGLFSVDIDFNFDNTSDFFTLVGNGTNYGTFAYTDLPVTLTDLEADGTTYEFIINDQEQPDCGGILGLDSENCGTDCQITDLIAEAWDCDADGAFYIDVNFNVNNAPTDSFKLLVSTPSLTALYTFAYSDLYVTIGPFAADGSVYQIYVSDFENQSCSAGTSVESEDCISGNNCNFSDLIVEAYDCDDQGMFFVDIDFNYVNTSDSFTVIGNGNDYGTFAYSDLFITLGPFEGNGSVYEFLIQDQEMLDCSSVLVLDSENCGSDCSISDLDVYPLDCNPDGSYSVLILFDYENVDSDFFDAYANGDFIGSFAYANLPLTIPSFPASGNDNDALTICNSSNDQCCALAEFQALDCDACEIEEVILNAGACDVDDNFLITIDLQISGGGQLGFMVLGNGTNYGTFDYTELPISLGPFEGDGITEYEFIIVDLANTACVGYATIGPILCVIPQPVWPGDANLDNTSNHFDLLNLGITYAETGPARTLSDIDWMSFDGDDWAGEFINGANWKHADCNGDGEVNNLDISAIETNYDLVHGDVIPYPEIDITPGSPLFYIDLPTFSDITMGQAFVAPIILGDIDTPVEEIYGIAFTIEYDPAMMDEAGVYVETGSSWLGEQGSQLINIDRSFADDGIIEVAITRTDHTNTGGFGTISYFIGIIDDIAGKSEVEINITNVVAITYQEERISLDTPSSVIDLTTSLENPLDAAVTVFPNPAQETLNVLTDGNLAPERIMIYNTLGQLIEDITAPALLQRIELHNWNTGIYFMDIQFASGKVTRKIEVLK